MNDWPTILATVGAILSIVSNIPQVLKVVHVHSTKSIHPMSVIIHMIGAFVWSIYGLILDLYILAGESFLVFFFWLLILVACIRDRYVYTDTVETKQLKRNTETKI